jgi:hypothetical protein
LEFLEDHAARVLLMEQPPELTFGNRNALQVVCSKRIRPFPGVKQYLPLHAGRAESSRSLVRNLASRYRNCDYIPIYDVFAEGSQLLVLDGRRVTYVDDDHLTTHGARLAIPRIEQKIAEAFQSPGTTPEKMMDLASEPADKTLR